MTAEELREELRNAGTERFRSTARKNQAEKRIGRLLKATDKHPEVSLAEAARLLGFKRRATVYDYLKQERKAR